MQYHRISFHLSLNGTKTSRNQEKTKTNHHDERYEKLLDLLPRLHEIGPTLSAFC